jgi:hypothetical protein
MTDPGGAGGRRQHSDPRIPPPTPRPSVRPRACRPAGATGNRAAAAVNASIENSTPRKARRAAGAPSRPRICCQHTPTYRPWRGTSAPLRPPGRRRTRRDRARASGPPAISAAASSEITVNSRILPAAPSGRRRRRWHREQELEGRRRPTGSRRAGCGAISDPLFRGRASRGVPRGCHYNAALSPSAPDVPDLCTAGRPAARRPPDCILGLLSAAAVTRDR